ncbi:unnamed protein product [Prorocentrum cordatum]|uniref:Uncharacterized protein n=1 Tax=Prorocentrum cordatum TaxID=2364126 RepID=A0ABN9X0L5_9DINO|nr:unnamed protein product [Polarella glacialis]
MHETTRRGRRSLRERAARARTPGCMHRQALRACRRRRAAPVQLSPPPLAEAGGAAGTGGACLPEFPKEGQARLHARACWSDATDLHRRPHTEERPRRRALAVRTDGAACATREFAQLAQVPEQAGGDPAPQPAGWNTTNPKELMDAAALKAPTDGLRSVAPLPPLDGKKKRGG